MQRPQLYPTRSQVSSKKAAQGTNDRASRKRETRTRYEQERSTKSLSPSLSLSLHLFSRCLRSCPSLPPCLPLLFSLYLSLCLPVSASPSLSPTNTPNTRKQLKTPCSYIYTGEAAAKRTQHTALQTGRRSHLRCALKAQQHTRGTVTSR